MKKCKECGKDILHGRSRRLCTDCLKEEQRLYYNFKKEIYNRDRKLKRKALNG